MTDLEDYGIEHSVAPKKTQTKRFKIKVFNCYCLIDEKTNTWIDKCVGFNNNDLPAREKMLALKEKLEKENGEYYEE